MLLLLYTFFRYTLAAGGDAMADAMNWQLLGERLHIARRRRDLTQYELAKEAGTTRVTVSRLENVDKPQVSFDVLVRIAQVLEVSLDWLAGR
jgi:transcriptional regulator with XRE-family HTH domain